MFTSEKCQVMPSLLVQGPHSERTAALNTRCLGDKAAVGNFYAAHRLSNSLQHWGKKHRSGKGAENRRQHNVIDCRIQQNSFGSDRVVP